MAEGAAKAAGADLAISVTGIAGPDGGTKEKPVGLVYVGCYADGEARAYEFHFTGNRAKKQREYCCKSIDDPQGSTDQLLMEGT